MMDWTPLTDGSGVGKAVTVDEDVDEADDGAEEDVDDAEEQDGGAEDTEEGSSRLMTTAGAVGSCRR